MNNTILKDLQNEILIITINRPDKLNALNKDVLAELDAAIDEVYDNVEIKSAIITGAGQKAFVAGADISEFLSLDGATGKVLAKKGHTIFDKIEHCTKPIVAAVNGFALGGGCELSMACHFRLASDNAKFGQPEVNLGIIPGYGGTQRLSSLVGKGKAIELMITGSMITASEALDLGLVNYVTSIEELLPKTISILQLVQTKAPIAVGKILALANDAVYDAANGLQKEIEAFGDLFDTQDAKEGAKAFVEKRKPTFIGS